MEDIDIKILKRLIKDTFEQNKKTVFRLGTIFFAVAGMLILYFNEQIIFGSHLAGIFYWWFSLSSIFIVSYYPSRRYFGLKFKVKKIAVIQRPPGSHLNSFALFFYSRKTYKQIYLPTICDMREEHFEALAADQKWKARWICVRGYFSFFSAMVAHVPLSGLQLVKKIWTIVG